MPRKKPFRLIPKINHYAVSYFYDGVRCPGCTMKNWLVGRVTAECGRCGYALLMTD